MKLSQVIALLSGKKTRVQKELTELYKLSQKPPLFDGLSRTYTPNEEGGETQPPEAKGMQANANKVLGRAKLIMADLWDSAMTQDVSNTTAIADITVDGVTVVTGVPVVTLLYLEKQLEDLFKFVETIPTLDPAERWTYDPNKDCYVSDVVITGRTKKVPKVIVKYEATKEHPAQTELHHEDVKVGEWKTIKFSAALPVATKNQFLERLIALRDAVKVAREGANGKDAKEAKIGAAIMDFVFAKS